jgi:hypothetical protein
MFLTPNYCFDYLGPIVAPADKTDKETGAAASRRPSRATPISVGPGLLPLLPGDFDPVVQEETRVQLSNLRMSMNEKRRGDNEPQPSTSSGLGRRSTRHAVLEQNKGKLEILIFRFPIDL